MLVHSWPRALGEEGVIRRLRKQSLPFELRRCSVAFWQRCRHQDVDWEGCAEGSEAPCTQEDEAKKIQSSLPKKTISIAFLAELKERALLIGTNWY